MATQETYELTDTLGRLSVEAGDKELTLSFQQGDPYAYEHIYQRYSQRVHAVCQRMLSDPQDAQDAAQETFLRAYQALPRFNGRYHLGAWINRIATNVCLDHLRSRSRTPAEAAPNDVLEEVVTLGRDDDPENVMLRSVEGDRVQETLAQLSPLHRTAIFMRDYEGRDYRDIASRLGVSESRARVLIHRARQGFKKSWSSSWVLLGLPARLTQKLKRMRSPGGDQVAQAASSAAHTGHAASSPVASCGNALAQCSEIVTERIATVATAAIVGVTAAGGAVPAVLDANVLRDAVRGVAATAAAAGSELVSGAVSEAVRGAPPEAGVSTRDESSGVREARGDVAAGAAVSTASAATGGELAGSPASVAEPASASPDIAAPIATEPPVQATPAAEAPAEAPAAVLPLDTSVPSVEGSEPTSVVPPVEDPNTGALGDPAGQAPPAAPSPSPSPGEAGGAATQGASPDEVVDEVVTGSTP